MLGAILLTITYSLQIKTVYATVVISLLDIFPGEALKGLIF